MLQNLFALSLFTQLLALARFAAIASMGAVGWVAMAITKDVKLQTSAAIAVQPVASVIGINSAIADITAVLISFAAVNIITACID